MVKFKRRSKLAQALKVTVKPKLEPKVSSKVQRSTTNARVRVQGADRVQAQMQVRGQGQGQVEVRYRPQRYFSTVGESFSTLLRHKRKVSQYGKKVSLPRQTRGGTYTLPMGCQAEGIPVWEEGIPPATNGRRYTLPKHARDGGRQREGAGSRSGFWE